MTPKVNCWKWYPPLGKIWTVGQCRRQKYWIKGLLLYVGFLYFYTHILSNHLWYHIAHHSYHLFSSYVLLCCMICMFKFFLFSFFYLLVVSPHPQAIHSVSLTLLKTCHPEFLFRLLSLFSSCICFNMHFSLSVLLPSILAMATLPLFSPFHSHFHFSSFIHSSPHGSSVTSFSFFHSHSSFISIRMHPHLSWLLFHCSGPAVCLSHGEQPPSRVSGPPTGSCQEGQPCAQAS